MGETTRGTGHLRALDGLRGAAVLGVVAFHLAALDGGDRRGVLAGGWLGVDTFFTLSGYLITSLLLAEMADHGRVDLRAFWRRRVRRLQPAALVAITAVVATAAWWSPAGTATSVRDQAFAALGAVANWQALLAHHAYAAGGSPSAFEHFWSLAVEEQFYLVWPLLLMGLARLGLGRRAVLRVAIGGTAVSWALLATASLQSGYLRTDTRMGSILAGAALAAVLPLGRRAATRTGQRLAGWVAGGGIVATGTLWAAAGWPPRAALGLLLPVHALITVALLAGVVLAPASLPARALAVRPLALVGRVSYGRYLWHWPVFVICTPARLGAGWAVTTVVRLTAVAALTAASWYLVEHPVRVGRVLPRTRLALPGAVAIAVVVTALAVHTVEPSPAWARSGSHVFASSLGTAVTVQLPPERPHRVLVVGDSIPTSMMAGPAATSLQMGVGKLLDQLAQRGVAAWGGTITGCPVAEQVIVIDGEAWRRCLETQRDVYPRLMALARPDLVVWYARQDAYPALLADGRLDGSLAGAERRISARVAWFAARGAKVAFVAPGPNRDGHDAYAPWGSARRSMAFLERAFDGVAAEHPGEVVGIIRMADLLCGGAPAGCPDRMPDGRLFRMDDGVHFTPEGALVAGDWLADRIAALDLSGGAALRGR
ncbi:MAG: acyltransferase 3 [Actinomycetia bacterium]|nr:acyltransferase 3 [Actinomycetes bacterium]